MQKHFILFIALLISCSSITQVNLDSLWGVWNDHTQPNTTRLKAINKIAWDGYLFSQPDSAFYFAQLVYDFAVFVNNEKWIAAALNTQGVSYAIRGNYEEALIYYKKSLKIKEKIGNQKGIANSLNNIGDIYKKQGDYGEALMFYKKSLHIFKETGDKRGISNSLSNIGDIYYKQGDYDQALNYYKKSIKIKKDIEDKIGISNSLGNIGGIYKDLGNFQEALTYFTDALKISKDINALDLVDDHSKALYEIYKKTGNLKKALEMYELYKTTIDTLSKQDAKDAATELKYQYRYETKAKLDSVRIRLEKDEEIFKQQAKLKVKQNEQIILFGGLGLVILFSLFMINRFRVISKQKKIIELQKDEVELKNEKILDSIQYAKSLQEAILPPNKLVKKWLPHSFILYNPKDIVAGDFYWMEIKKDCVYFAAADCTGHGVRGAMVSVVCSNALSVAVLDEGKTKPSEILDRTKELIIERFGRSEQVINDGMDISLCALNYKTGMMQWAGANCPLWIIRSGSEELEVIKADRLSLGIHLRNIYFKNHEFKLNKGDSIYLFSDGYSDQFGGEKGEKYKSANFKHFLLSIQDKNMEIQHKLLSKEFDRWKGTFEQIDDVCVMGVRI